MEERKARLKDLLEKWFNGHISVQEEQELNAMVKDNVYKEIVAEKFETLWDNMPNTAYNEQHEAMHLADEILQNNPTETSNPIDDVASRATVNRIHILKTAWFRYAAVIILAVGVGVYSWFQNSNKELPTSENKHTAQEIAPGKEGAILTLADGTEVVLDSLGNGLVATQSGSKVLLTDGQLAYEATEKQEDDLAYNIVRTPKGRQFNLRLADGTQVWLNAASTLKYPTRFSGKDRVVEITGEAYFEVAQNAQHPFFLKINNQALIEVLGTSFNVNAYENETSIHTTLISGSVRVSSGVAYDKEQTTQKARIQNNSVVLRPGQQATLFNAIEKSNQQTASSLPQIQVSNAAIDKVIAWKNGFFSFQHASLQEVMKQLERWYDVDVVYEKGIPDIRFMGAISRSVKLSEVLLGLEDMGVHFRIESGRRLVVMP